MYIQHKVETGNKKFDSILSDMGFFLEEKENPEIYPNGQPEHEWQLKREIQISKHTSEICWLKPKDLFEIFMKGVNND